jgi:hypothetical protein
VRHDQVKLRLTIDVIYTLYGAGVAELKRTLINASQHLEENCLLSGETAACVEHWESTVVELDPAHAVNKVL